METEFWNFKELLAFIMIHASHADLEFSPDERKHIKAEVGVEVFDKMDAIYNQGSDYQNLKKILAHKDKYFATEEEKALFLQKIHDQCLADGDFSRLEKTLFRFLEMML